jgi:hypothetical protein
MAKRPAEAPGRPSRDAATERMPVAITNEKSATIAHVIVGRRAPETGPVGPVTEVAFESLDRV